MHAHFLGMHVFLYKYDSLIVVIVQMICTCVYVQGRERGRKREREITTESLPCASQMCSTGL